MKKITWKSVLLWLAALVAILVPCLTLFQEGNWLSYVIADNAMHREWLEILILTALLVPVCLCIRNGKVLSAVLAGMILLTAYLHSMLLPLLLAGLWFFILMLTKNLVAGIAAAIVIAGILSLFGQCTPNNMLLVTSAVQIVLRIAKMHFCAGKKFPLCQQRQREPFILFGKCRAAGDALPVKIKSGTADRLLSALIVLVLLVQIGRANECVDFDSLWYGVRSLRMLAPGGNIFEDLGLVGMVYTYPKGFEILTLPLNMTESYAVISAFNLFLFVYALFITAKIAERMTSAAWAKAAVLFTVLVPGIVNMTLSAKPDIITWLLQLVMLDRFFDAITDEKPGNGITAASCTDAERSKRRSLTAKSLSVISVYLLSLTMKPTALIFSTALIGMMFLWTAFRAFRRKDKEGRSLFAENNKQATFLFAENNKQATFLFTENSKQATSLFAEGIIAETFFSVLALAIVWGRTMKLTGMPFTSVFTGILEKLGFTMKYPFSSRSLPSTWQEGSQFIIACKRMVKMLLMPCGKDMSHVIIAWGGSLFFVLGVMILWNLIAGIKVRNRRNKAEINADSTIFAAAAVVFIPFILTCFVTLMMLYQVDGNYYMTLYSVVIFLAAALEYRSGKEGGKQGRSLFAVLVFQFLIMTMTNWAGVTGFTEIRANSGLFSHVEYYREQLTETDGSLYGLLASDPETRVVAFGDHPTCLQFPCIVQSYNDITSPWGNVEIVNTADAFIDYLHFAEVDYVYGDAAHLKEEAWQWSKGLIDEMTARGVLTDFVYEGENWIARVN